jgi:hypothetical protein
LDKITGGARARFHKKQQAILNAKTAQEIFNIIGWTTKIKDTPSTAEALDEKTGKSIPLKPVSLLDGWQLIKNKDPNIGNHYTTLKQYMNPDLLSFYNEYFNKPKALFLYKTVDKITPEQLTKETNQIRSLLWQTYRDFGGGEVKSHTHLTEPNSGIITFFVDF